MPADPAELAAVARELRSAAEATDDAETATELSDLADRFDGLREAEPDHGTLARLDNSLRELCDETNGAVTEHVEDARDQVREYRKGVEGV